MDDPVLGTAVYFGQVLGTLAIEKIVKRKSDQQQTTESDVALRLIELGRCVKCQQQTHLVKQRFGRSSEKIPLTNETVLNGRCLVCNPPLVNNDDTTFYNSVTEEDGALSLPCDTEDKKPASMGNQGVNPPLDEKLDVSEKIATQIQKLETGTSEETTEACNFFLKLSSQGEKRILISQEGGILAIICAMNRHENSSTVQSLGCALLCNLACNCDCHKAAITSEHGIPAIIKAMQQHKTVPEVQERACAAICSLSMEDNAREEIAKADGISAVLTAMNHHVMVAGVQQQACGALRNLASGRSYDDSIKLTIASLGGIESIITAIRTHSNVTGVQKNARGALQNLDLNPDEIIEERVILAADGCSDNTHGGHNDLVATTIAYPQQQISEGIPDSSAITEQIRQLNFGMAENAASACDVLCNLALEEKQRVRIVRAGGISAIVNAMKRHENESRIQYRGCNALLNLAYQYDSHKVAIRDADGIAAIVKAMQHHENVSRVQERACATLCSLSINDKVREEIVSKDGIPAILAAMRRFVAESGVQQQACGALRNLASSRDVDDISRQIIATFDGISAILTAMRLHKYSSGVQENACGALRNLALNHEIRYAIVAAGGLSTIREASTLHMNHPGVQEQARWAQQ